jgi:flagellar hook protein FlgE
MEGDIKQGTGDLRACGPCTFRNAGSFIKYGEVVPMRDSLCASADKIAVNKIDQAENGNINENVHEKANAKKSVDIEIDLNAKIEKIESSTQKESIAAEQDFITNAEPLSTIDPIDDAVPVNTGDSNEEFDTLERNVINLCQTISCIDTVLNVGYDSGATVTLVSKKVAEMSIETKKTKYMLDTVGEKEGLRGSVTVRVPLAMKNGGMHVLNALVTDKVLGEVAMLPPHYDVEKVLAVPER